MKKSSITILVISFFLLVSISLYILYIRPASQIRDFSGTVAEIFVDDEVYCFKVKHSDSTYTVYADNITKICFLGTKKSIPLSEISVGDFVIGDYRLSFKKNFAKCIEVEYYK